MAKFLDDIAEKVKKGFNVAAERTKEYTKIGELKVDILALNRSIDKAYKTLGEESYTFLKKQKSSPLAEKAQVKKLIKEIDDLKKSIKSKETEIEKVKKEAEKEISKDKPSEKKAAASKPAPKPASKPGPAKAKPAATKKPAPKKKTTARK